MFCLILHRKGFYYFIKEEIPSSQIDLTNDTRLTIKNFNSFSNPRFQQHTHNNRKLWSVIDTIAVIVSKIDRFCQSSLSFLLFAGSLSYVWKDFCLEVNVTRQKNRKWTCVFISVNPSVRYRILLRFVFRNQL